MAKKTQDIKNSPIAWFYLLEDARRRNDFDRAARAKRELERLGVLVTYAKAIRAGVRRSRDERRAS